MARLRILTWHTPGRYLELLARTGHEFYLPVKPGHPVGYVGRGGLDLPLRVIEVPANEVPRLELDVVLSQSRQNWLVDRDLILSPAQRELPRIHLEHDPPREHPTDARHVVDDPDALLVHVTHFNDLMWDPGRTPTRVIEHGIVLPEGVRWNGKLDRGLVVAHGLGHRGRWTGADLIERARRRVPLDIVGMGSEAFGGLGAVPHAELAAFAADYRFFFHPVRYAGLGLAVCEAMLLGMPIVSLATAEMPTVVVNGVSGWSGTDVDWLIDRMCDLLADPAQARRLGAGARATAERRFAVDRFTRDWNDAFAQVSAGHHPPIAVVNS